MLNGAELCVSSIAVYVDQCQKCACRSSAQRSSPQFRTLRRRLHPGWTTSCPGPGAFIGLKNGITILLHADSLFILLPVSRCWLLPTEMRSILYTAVLP